MGKSRLRSRRAHLGSSPTGTVYFMESDTNGEVESSGFHSSAADAVSRLRQHFTIRVCSSLRRSMVGGGGNAPLSSASTASPLRSYLSRSSSAMLKAFLTP